MSNPLLKNDQSATRMKTQMASLRVTKKTAEILKSKLSQINKKEFGRNVTASEYLLQAITLMSPQDDQKLQNATLSNEDKMKLGHREYCKKNGETSWDTYVGLVFKYGFSNLEKGEK